MMHERGEAIRRKLIQKYKNEQHVTSIEQSIDKHENILHWVMLLKHVFGMGVSKLYVF